MDFILSSFLYPGCLVLVVFGVWGFFVWVFLMGVFLKFFLLFLFLMLHEILAGKMPRETSLTIHPVFYVLLKYMDPACAAACCQVHYILSIRAPK